jgi:hypothetical protein
MRNRSRPAVAAVILMAWGCTTARAPIDVHGGTVTIENQTSRPWRNVVVTVNDHFRGGAPLLAAGSLLTAPLSQFQTAFGQRFVPGRQSVVKIEVTATDSNGEPVSLRWDRLKR